VPDAARDRDHGFLCCVERIVVIDEHPPTHGMDAVGMAFEQRFECTPVTAVRECRERVVGGVLVVTATGSDARQRPSTLISAICSLLDGGRCVHHTSTYWP
jgi:hypothetical protein